MGKIYRIPICCFSMTILIFSCTGKKEVTEQPVLGTRSVTLIEEKGIHFKDLNRNGELDPYEDWRLTPEARSQDLLSKMSLEDVPGYLEGGEYALFNYEEGLGY